MRGRILTLTVLASFLLFILTPDLAAKERRGAELLILEKDGTQIRGELIAVKQNSLLLLDAVSGGDVQANIEDINAVTIIKRSKAGKGALIGFLAGSGIGVISVLLAGGNHEEDVWAGFFSDIFRALAVVLFMTAGTVIGLIFGAAAGKDEIVRFEGKSPEQIRGILEKLRYKARIPHFQ
jgi:hypothetical protein